MTTNQHSTFIELYRLYSEMVDEKDFIQSLERLRSGTPSESKDSDSSAVAAGINRPLARLVHNTDAVLETLQSTRFAQLLSDNVVLEWDGSTLTIKPGTLSFEVPVTGFAGNGSADGKIVYSTTNATDDTVAIAEGSIVYLEVDRTLTSAEDLTSNLSVATSDSLMTTIQAAASRLKVVPIAYNVSGCLNFFCNSISLPSGSNYTFDTGINSFYTRSSVFNNNRNALILFDGDTQVYARWTSSSNQLNYPQFSIVVPGVGSHTVISSGSVSSFTTGKSLVVNLDTNSISSTSTFDFDGVNNNMLVIARRNGNRVILFNGIQFPTGSDLAYIPFNRQLSHDLAVNIREGDYELALESNSSLSANRSLTFDVNNVNRTIDLSSNLTVGSGGLTTGSGAVSFGSNTLSVGASGTVTLGSGDLTTGTGDVTFSGGTYSFGSGDITTSSGDLSLSTGNVSFTNTGNISLNQSLTTSSNVTFGAVSATGNLTTSAQLRVDGVYGRTNSTQALFINQDGSSSTEAGSVRVNNNLYVDGSSYVDGNSIVNSSLSGQYFSTSISSTGTATMEVVSGSYDGKIQLKSDVTEFVPKTTNGDIEVQTDGYTFLRLQDNWGSNSKGILWVNERSSETMDYAMSNGVSSFLGRVNVGSGVQIENPLQDPAYPGNYDWTNGAGTTEAFGSVSLGNLSAGVTGINYYHTSAGYLNAYVGLVSTRVIKAGCDVILEFMLTNEGSTNSSYPLEVGYISASDTTATDSSFTLVASWVGSGVLATSSSISTYSSYREYTNFTNISQDYKIVIRQKRPTNVNSYEYRIAGIRVYSTQSAQQASLNLYASKSGVSVYSEQLVRFYNSSNAIKGSITLGQNGETVTYSAFTGCHYGTAHSDEPTPEELRGKLVSVHSASNEIDGGVEDKEPTYQVKITRDAQDPKCLGVFEDEKILCIGNGTLKVCNQGGDISRGDYICSASDVPGTGMKQSEDSHKNYTVAKAMSPATWTGDDSSVKLINVIYLGG